MVVILKLAFHVFSFFLQGRVTHLQILINNRIFVKKQLWIAGNFQKYL